MANYGPQASLLLLQINFHGNTCLFLYLLPIAALALQQQSGVVTKIMYLEKPKDLLHGLLWEKFAEPLSRPCGTHFGKR